jgi:hypothetical protein
LLAGKYLIPGQYKVYFSCYLSILAGVFFSKNCLFLNLLSTREEKYFTSALPSLLSLLNTCADSVKCGLAVGEHRRYRAVRIEFTGNYGIIIAVKISEVLSF